MHISLFNFALKRGRGNSIGGMGGTAVAARWCGGGIWLSLKATRRRVFAICMHNLLSVVHSGLDSNMGNRIYTKSKFGLNF